MTADTSAEVAWALESAANPSVLRLHTMLELTKRTIVACPPATAVAPLDQLLVIPGIRSVELHRYLARLNLYPGADTDGVWSAVIGSLMPSWGRPVDPPEIEHDPRSFPVNDDGPRRVAESLEMAADDPILGAMFRVHGVAEAILEHGHVRIRPGRLFDWEHVQPRVVAALAEPSTS